ncbi:type II secretion system F family protein [Dyella amyloliquefaciens]|uniref:type II secretion system F family protein n=1 Tax=Dyella amyloliquefaciens TaxID=1770545 RepID=UPI00102E9ADF|nr:type II secretion system F family protein [Dyella amyloliquefaciens]
MTQVLALASLALILLAVAIDLWWGSALRLQQRKSMDHIDARLGSRAISEARPVVAPAVPVAQGLRQRMDEFLLEAALPAGRRIYVALVSPGVLLTVLAWWRIGSALAMPLIGGVYTAAMWLWLRRRAEQQRRQMVGQLPDFLDGMIRLTSVGNSLPMAFQSAAKSMSAPLRGVLDRTLLSMHAGVDLDQALATASRPYALEELSLLHSVLGVGIRVGGRADHILQRMSDFMRDHAHARSELHAITSETRMSAWVLGLLPLAVSALMMLVDPAFFSPMFTQPLGHKLFAIALGLEAGGAVLLYRQARSL